MVQVVDYKRPKKSETKQEKSERNKRVVSVELPPEVVNEIHTICGEEGIRRSKLVRKLIQLGLPIYIEGRDGEQA